MRNLSRVRADEPMRIIAQPVRVSIWAVAGAWVGRRLIRLLILIVTTPAALAGLALIIAATWVWRHVSPVVVIVVLVLVVAGLVVWRVWRPAGFARWVRLPVRGWRRGWWVYRRRWTAAMDTANLTITRHNTEYVPPILRVRSTLSVDRVRVRMLAGQTLDDYATVGPRLAQTFGASDCRIRGVPRRLHEVDLWLLTRDPLRQVVEPMPIDTDPLGEGLPVALAEDGQVWRLQLIGSHVLVVGATGAGKGSVIWSLLLQLAPSIRAGVVKVWAVDPKGGMELAAGQPLFDRFCHGNADQAAGYETSFADLLEDAVHVMRKRQDRLRGVTRLHEPSTGEPLIVLVIDELAALTGWVLDRGAKKRIETALGLLLSQGRAVGVVVVGAVQDPRKDVLPMRDLFPTRIALRLNEAEQVGLVLGPGARSRGALCDLIPDSLPGVGYVAVDGISEPIRVRFSHITDDLTHNLAKPPAEPGQAKSVLRLVAGGAA